jgi:hypothetical protein
MSEGMVLLALAAVVVVLLVVHRSEGDLGRALVEYALVAVLAVLLAATPSTAGMTAGVASGVTSGSRAAGSDQARQGIHGEGEGAAEGGHAAPTGGQHPGGSRPVAAGAGCTRAGGAAGRARRAGAAGAAGAPPAPP